MDDTGEPVTHGLSRRLFIKGAAAASGAVAADLSVLGRAASAAPNPISIENALAGAPEWDIQPDESIEGFATEMSVNAGQAISFKVKTDATNYRIEIFRIGWYGGIGARRVATILPSVSLPQQQPEPLYDDETRLTDCGNWAVSATWNVPASAVSGVYVARLLRLDAAGGENRILFVVRNDGRSSDIHVQTSDTTYQAYNPWGGASLYSGATKVSYNRPNNQLNKENHFWYAELPLVRWLERNGYDVTYTSCIDTDRRPAELLRHRVFVSSGHDEYWSGAMRANVEAARDAGVHLIFMSGNEVFWKVRWEPSTDGTATPYRTMVCYKETFANAKTDPSPEWTGTWRDPRFSPPSNGGRPENALTGTLFKAINPLADVDFAIEVPYEYSRLRFWRNTSIATLAPGATATLCAESLGYEWDTDGDFPGRPRGLIRLSQTTRTAAEVLVDYGATYVSMPLTHHMTMYRAASGALVWGTGTVQWSWGLDDYHDTSPPNTIPADVRMQQATTNVLADMGVQPATRQSNLVAATASTDTVPPAATITAPAAGFSAPIGTVVTITGTAVDTGGGRVAGVEVSTDDGATWHPATGTASWTYSFVPMVVGPHAIRARATDDSCNTGAASAARLVQAVARAVPCSIWPNQAAPALSATTDPDAVELGVRFRTRVAGFATGVRFFKGSGNTGAHRGRIWTGSGTLLADVAFSGETASGWQQATLPEPVKLDADVTYVASYLAPNGHYAYDADYFARTYDLAPLTALRNGEDGPNGVFGSPGEFPTMSFGAANYWVDIVFDTDNRRPPTVIDTSPAEGVSAVAADSTISFRFNEPVDPASVVFELRDPQGVLLPGSASADPSGWHTFVPSAPMAAPGTHTARVLAARDVSGEAMTVPFTWSFTTTGAPGGSPATIWTSSDVPSNPTATDAHPVELGLRFSAAVDGNVVAIRFFKGTNNRGVHVGRLWTTGGTLLGSVTFERESSTGWQEARLAQPVAIKAGEVYVVSYHAPSGGYAYDPGFFDGADVVRGTLRALSRSSGPNGVFRYGSPGGFPTSTYAATNYWVDVVFEETPDVTAPSIVDRAPAPDLQAVSTSALATATFDKPVDPASIVFSLTPEGGAAVAATLSYDAAARRAVLTPAAPLAVGVRYTVSVRATSSPAGGEPMANPDIWSFTTVAPPGSTPATLWDTSAVPERIDAGDGSSVEVGVRFHAARDGAVAAIRFYRAPTNAGPHVGHLWAIDGTLLGTAVFGDRSRSGWQQAALPAPIPVSAGQTYVASYVAPTGHYSITASGLAAGRDRSPLHAPSSGAVGGNGVFTYGAGGFPTSSYQAANYWVDVVFVDAVAPVVVEQSPSPGAVAVDPGAVVWARMSEPIQPATAALEVRDGGGAVISGSTSTSADESTVTFTPAASLAPASAFTVTLSGARDLDGTPIAAPVSWTFATSGGAGANMFGSLTPAIASVADPGPVELGTVFRSARSASVRGVRFYKGNTNTGTHVGHLWSLAGDLLATAEFTGESPTGWQYAAFPTATPIDAGVLYVVSYHTSSGNYAVNSGFFNAGDFTNGDLTAVAAATTANGRYRYGASGFPSSSWNGTNYWVDVVVD